MFAESKDEIVLILCGTPVSIFILSSHKHVHKCVQFTFDLDNDFGIKEFIIHCYHFSFQVPDISVPVLACAFYFRIRRTNWQTEKVMRTLQLLNLSVRLAGTCFNMYRMISNQVQCQETVSFNILDFCDICLEILNIHSYLRQRRRCGN